MLLTKEQFNGSPPALPTEDIDVPEFGAKMRVRAWTGVEYDEFAKAVKSIEYDGHMYSAAVAVSAIGENGERLFDTNGDISRILTTLRKTTLESAYEAIQKMNRLGKQGLEDAEKN